MKPLYIVSTPTTYRVQFEYNAQLIECMHRIPSRPRWDGEEKCWVVKKDKSLYPSDRDGQWYVYALAKWAIQKSFVSGVKETEQEQDSFYELPTLTGIKGEHYMLLNPYPYQLEGVGYALEHKRCIFGDQPGLGKTLQAICSVVKAHKESDTYGESFPCLVVCPAALKVNWQREFKKFAGIDAIILDNKNKDTWHLFAERKTYSGESLCNVFITNYESLKKFFVQEIKNTKRMTQRSIVYDERIKIFKSVIIDESHKCKSAKTQQSKILRGITKGKEFIFALTGTPVVNNNTDLIQQLNILGRLEDFGGYRRFMDTYCGGPQLSSNMRELNWRLWTKCFFRREKAKVLTQLPEKTRQYISVDITNKKEYNDAEKDIISYLKEYKKANDDELRRAMRGAVMVKMTRLKEISARGKIKAMSEFIHDVIDGGEKLIVFAFLKEVIAALKKEFPHAVTVTGSDNIKAKQYAVDSFQEKPDCKLIILNYKSGGTGLTLTAASRVAFIEFPWTYSDCEQAEDRAHRNGQKNNVNCYYFLGEGTIDKYMYEVVQSKKKIANEVTGTSTQIEENMVNLTLNLFKDKIV